MQKPNAVEPTEQLPSHAHESRAVHRCEALKRDASACGRYVATVFLGGLWRCPAHRPRTVKEGASGLPAAPARLPRPPVTALKEPSDALQLSSWAAIQLARGRLDHQRANAIAAQCREFRIAWTAESRGETQVALLAAWERAQDAEDAGDRETLKASRADMRRLFAELGVPTKVYQRPTTDPEPYGGAP